MAIISISGLGIGVQIGKVCCCFTIMTSYITPKPKRKNQILQKILFSTAMRIANGALFVIQTTIILIFFIAPPLL
jgi:hypothetical protein